MLDGGSRQEADKTSCEENESCLKTKIPGHDIYWVSMGKRAACLPVQMSSEPKNEIEVTAGCAVRRRDDDSGLYTFI